MAKPMTFRYREFPITRHGSRGKIGSLKPIIEIPITEKKKIHCLIDSGSDVSISFKSIGESYFGFNFSEDERVPNRLSGLHTCKDFECKYHPQKAKVYLKQVSIKINGVNIKLNVHWIDRKFNTAEDFLLLLGRDFFQYFDIRFNQTDEEFVLYPK